MTENEAVINLKQRGGDRQGEIHFISLTCRAGGILVSECPVFSC